MLFILCQNQEIMRLWTIQTIEFYDALRKNGVVHCDRESWLCREYREMYDWMADEMRKRIGNPPNPVVRYPLWAWLTLKVSTTCLALTFVYLLS